MRAQARRAAVVLVSALVAAGCGASSPGPTPAPGSAPSAPGAPSAPAAPSTPGAPSAPETPTAPSAPPPPASTPGAPPSSPGTPPPASPPAATPPTTPPTTTPPTTTGGAGAAVSPAVRVEGAPLPAPACSVGLQPDPPDSVPAAQRVLAPAWELAAPAGWTIGFEGVQDADGDLYWQERRVDGTPGAAVASATRDGRLRWRVEVGAAARAALVSGGRVVVAIAGGDPTFPGRLAALDAASGAAVWTLDLAAIAAALVPADRGPPRADVRVDHPSVLAGVVTFPVGAVDQPGYVWPGLLRVDLASGAVREIRAIATDLTIWVPGEPAVTAGATYAIVRPTQGSDALLAFGADGGPRVALPLATDDNLWVVGATDRHVIATGASGAAPVTGPPFLEWLALDGRPLGRVAGTGVTDFLSAGGVAFTAGAGRVARVDLDACAVAWQRTLARVAPSDRGTQRFLAEAWPIRTAGGGILVAFQPQTMQGTSATMAGEAAWVVELGPDGAEAFRGRLPDGLLFGGAATLHRGRWITTAGRTVSEHRLVAYDLAGQDAAATGWITRQGSPARDRAAR